MLKAQDLFKKGISCRIGNGHDVNILNTPWLPSTADPYIHSDNDAISNQKVASLFRLDEKVWDIDLILDVFETRDVELILSIPLSEDDKDTWYWRFEEMGDY